MCLSIVELANFSGFQLISVSQNKSCNIIYDLKVVVRLSVSLQLLTLKFFNRTDLLSNKLSSRTCRFQTTPYKTLVVMGSHILKFCIRMSLFCFAMLFSNQILVRMPTKLYNWLVSISELIWDSLRQLLELYGI